MSSRSTGKSSRLARARRKSNDGRFCPIEPAAVTRKAYKQKNITSRLSEEYPISPLDPESEESTAEVRPAVDGDRPRFTVQLPAMACCLPPSPASRVPGPVTYRYCCWRDQGAFVPPETTTRSGSSLRRYNAGAERTEDRPEVVWVRQYTSPAWALDHERNDNLNPHDQGPIRQTASRNPAAATATNLRLASLRHEP
ncbi:hypothetical protein BC826DRAFT_972685 [Russula brevipes]|nr:hypothetical protein BC826DRAFT_972685 [Russula brevipes]